MDILPKINRCSNDLISENEIICIALSENAIGKNGVVELPKCKVYMINQDLVDKSDKEIEDFYTSAVGKANSISSSCTNPIEVSELGFTYKKLKEASSSLVQGGGKVNLIQTGTIILNGFTSKNTFPVNKINKEK